jgi:hypothetical protein
MITTIWEYSTWIASYPISAVMYVPSYFYHGFYDIAPGEFSKGIKWGIKLGLTGSLLLVTVTGVLPSGIININHLVSTICVDNDIE